MSYRTSVEELCQFDTIYKKNLPSDLATRDEKEQGSISLVKIFLLNYSIRPDGQDSQAEIKQIYLFIYTGELYLYSPACPESPRLTVRLFWFGNINSFSHHG